MSPPGRPWPHAGVPTGAAAATGWRRRDLRLLLLALLMLVAWDASGWDLALSRQFGDAGGFAWRQAWWARGLLHDGGRVLAWACLGAVVLGLWRPWLAGPTRAQRLYWLGVLLACLLLVPALKRWSLTSCPWDLAMFGGTAAYVPHWRPGVADGGGGHCFPSGHAVSAFAFFALYGLWRPHRPRLARGLLLLTLLFGLLSGWTQLVRGAHFASHALWSAWLCAAVVVLARPLAPGLGGGPDWPVAGSGADGQQGLGLGPQVVQQLGQ